MATPGTSCIQCSCLCECVHISCFGHLFIYHHRLMRWVTEIYNAFTTMPHSTILMMETADSSKHCYIIYQITRYHISEDMKLQSLLLESKPHLALEILHTFNQNRTMENVKYMLLNTCHKPFNLYRAFHNVLRAYKHL